MLNLKKSTVHDIIQCYVKEDRIEARRQTGRPKSLSVQDERFLVRSIVRDPKIEATKLAEELTRRSGKKIGAYTIRRTLNREGYNARNPRRKPYISTVNRQKRLAFAQKYVAYPETFWKRVLYTDESKYNIFGSDGKRRVWRKENTALHPKHLNMMVKHGGRNVLVWGCCAASGVGSLEFIDGTMTAASYLDILRTNLIPSVEKLGIQDDYYFWQDNDPKH